MARHFLGSDPTGLARKHQQEVTDGLAYGETPPVTVHRLLRLLLEVPRGSTFVDLGCGRGLPVLTAASLGYPSLGVELLEGHLDAPRRVATALGLPATFLVGDFLDAPVPEGDVYLVASTAFPQSVRERLEQRLGRSNPGSLIVTQDWTLAGPEFQSGAEVRLPVDWGIATFRTYRRS